MNFSTRKASRIKKVLQHPEKEIPQRTYYMLRNIPFFSNKQERFDLTIMPSFKLGSEFNKTFGHIHSGQEPETYKILLGKALFVLQKMGKTSDIIDDLKIIKGQTGDIIKIIPGWYHKTVNIGKLPLVLVNWIPHGTENDYSLIEQQQGFGYYVVAKNGNFDLVKNKNYRKVPEAKIIDSQEVT